MNSGGTQWPGGSSPEGGGSGEGDDWILTYADAITLLMAFFVMMFSVSHLDHDKYTELKSSIEAGLGNREASDPKSALDRENPSATLDPARQSGEAPGLQGEKDERMEESISNLKQTLQLVAGEGDVEITRTERGFEIELASSSFYETGSADIRKDRLSVFETIAKSMLGLEQSDYEIEIEGHTDDRPISGGKFESNWELSATRATKVVRLFVEKGVASAQIKASAFADTRPKEETLDLKGKVEPALRAENRRVVIRVEQTF
jgi:chemotaxis protein MotB